MDLIDKDTKFWSEMTLEKLQTYLRDGADVHARGQHDYTPLHLAVLSASPEVIKGLLDAGADVDARDEFKNTSLHGAAWGAENPKVMNVLLDGGADVDARNQWNTTPLHNAVDINQQNREVTAKILLKAGARTNIKNEHGTALDVAKENEFLEGSEILKLL